MRELGSTGASPSLRATLRMDVSTPRWRTTLPATLMRTPAPWTHASTASVLRVLRRNALTSMGRSAPGKRATLTREPAVTRYLTRICRRTRRVMHRESQAVAVSQKYTFEEVIAQPSYSERYKRTLLVLVSAARMLLIAMMTISVPL